MKRFKFLMMILAIGMMAGVTGCQKNGPDNGIDADFQSYVTLNIFLPSDNAATRDGEDSGDYDPGIAAERNVTEVNLYFFDKSDDKYVATVSFAGTAELTSAGPGADHKTVVTSVKKKTPLIKGHKYNVFAIVNGQAGTAPASLVGMDIADFMKDDKLANQTFLTSVPGTGLVMASRTTTGVNTSSPFVELEILANNNEANPATLTLDVERTVAKLMLTRGTANVYNVAADGSTDGTGTTIATVELQKYIVVNTMKDGFTFRHTALVGDVFVPTYGYGNISTGINPIENSYVMDPLTHLKNAVNLVNPDYTNNTVTWYNNHVSALSAATSFTSASSMPTTTTPAIIGYCNENATAKEFQKNGYSTGLVFQAQVTPVAVLGLDGGGNLITIPQPASFYLYNGKFYEDIDAINKVYSSGTVPTASTDKVLKDQYGIEHFTNGICYYKYWIKHLDNLNPPAEPVMGVMEYSVVRNNVYKMKVSGISGVGTGIIDDIDPNEDNEIAEVFLRMEMTILPWIVRNNEDIIL